MQQTTLKDIVSTYETLKKRGVTNPDKENKTFVETIIAAIKYAKRMRIRVTL